MNKLKKTLNQMAQFDDFRKIYINNLKSRECPILPAYFFYLEHTSSRNILNQREFEILFMKGINDSIHPISLEFKPAQMNLDEIYNTLDKYFDIQYLHNKEGELIKII